MDVLDVLASDGKIQSQRRIGLLRHSHRHCRVNQLCAWRHDGYARVPARSIGAFLIHQLLLPKEARKSVVAIALLLVFGFFIKIGLETLNSGKAWDRLRQGVMREDLSLKIRERATAASIEMLRENWHIGVGAGSFRFLFPIYQHRHPELVTRGGRRQFWEHAHNDLYH